MANQRIPANLEAERCVLGSLLISNETVDEVTEILAPEHFSDEAHRRIYVALSELADHGKSAISAPAMLEELGFRLNLDKVGGTPYLAEMVESVPFPGHATHYAEIVRDEWLKRNGEA